MIRKHDDGVLLKQIIDNFSPLDVWEKKDQIREAFIGERLLSKNASEKIQSEHQQKVRTIKSELDQTVISMKGYDPINASSANVPPKDREKAAEINRLKFETFQKLDALQRGPFNTFYDTLFSLKQKRRRSADLKAAARKRTAQCESRDPAKDADTAPASAEGMISSSSAATICPGCVKTILDRTKKECYDKP
ncbi:MAG: hypothetical protein K6E18_05065 [Lachnospiraceae bacterium]|nr:hypothetical protein [Lachnospiraceae bacterium]